MGLTLIEKILRKHSLSKQLEDFIYAKVDFCFGNDITAPLAVKEFNSANFINILILLSCFVCIAKFKNANLAFLSKGMYY